MFLSPAFAGGEASKPKAAWWYDIAFKADQDNLSGLPVKSLDPTWVAARALSTRDLVGRISSNDLKIFKASKFRFSSNSDLNNDGKLERVLVGVFKREDGVSGRFLVVINGDSPQQVFVQQGDQGFSALIMHSNSL